MSTAGSRLTLLVHVHILVAETLRNRLRIDETNKETKPLMKKALAVLLISALATGAFAACPPDGQCPVFGCNWYDWISNSQFSSSSCWTFSGNVVYKSDGQMCATGGYAQFNQTLGGSTLSQTFHIPGPGEPGYVGGPDPSHFEFDYALQINDPNHSTSNVLTINIYDAHTNATLQHIATWHGSDTNPNCSRTYVDFHNSLLLGKDVRVEIVGSVPYSNSNFKINQVYLWEADAVF